jgi:DNA-binding LacI/PurR family transcriptional regulator
LLDPFLSKFIGSIGLALRDHDYDLLITEGAMGDEDVGARYVRTGRADGIVFIGRTTADEHLVARMAADAPMVVWGPQLPEQAYCSVGIDNRLWSQKAMAHLLALGRRRIAFLGEDPSWIEVTHRYQGYEAALQQAGRPLDPDLVTYISTPDRAGKVAMRQLLARSPDIDGVFANSDVAAIAAMQVLQENGRAVPGDVAVIGFDNIAIGNYTSPALTTISQNLTDGVPLLIEKLLQLINGETVASVTIPGRLVIRQSCGAAKAN